MERRLLETRVEQLDAELKERDRLDAEIESVVAGVFERLRALEQENEELKAAMGGRPHWVPCHARVPRRPLLLIPRRADSASDGVAA